MSLYRLPLWSFNGIQQGSVEFDVSQVTIEATDAKNSTKHHVIIVDRSGSMYSLIDPVKSTIRKVLALSEFDNPNQLVSLISYSGRGDVVTHISRVKVEEVMAPGSSHYESIDQIRATGLTCISGSLVAALTLLRKDESTCITLHSDGYANDPSSFLESKTIDQCVRDILALCGPNVSLNTIAHGEYSDFITLSRVANAAFGQCLVAKNINVVYSAIRQWQEDLVRRSSGVSPVVIKNGAPFVFGYHNETLYNGVRDGQDTVISSPLSVGQTLTVYQWGWPEQLGTAFRNASVEAPEYTNPDKHLVAARLALSFLNNGQVDLAKKVMGYKPFYKALTPTQLADMQVSLSSFLVAGPINDLFSSGGVVPYLGTTVLQLLQYLASVSKHISVAPKNYKRRTVKRIPGTRLDDGTLVEPSYKLIPESESWNLLSVDFNRTSANVNINLGRNASLSTQDGEKIAKVAGVDVTVNEFRTFTIVGDGVVNANLSVTVRSVKVFSDLRGMLGDLIPESYTPGMTFDIDLQDMLVVRDDFTMPLNRDSMKVLVAEMALNKVISAIKKQEPPASHVHYTEEQIAEFDSHYLKIGRDGSMSFSVPTTTVYSSVDEAVASGMLDYRTAYKVEVGFLSDDGSQFVTPAKIPSANAYVDRRFVGSSPDDDASKAADPSVRWTVKTLSARTKLTAMDDLLFPVFNSILINRELENHPDLGGLYTANELRIETAFSHIQNLVFIVGSTGMFPSSVEAKQLSQDEVDKITLTKAEKEASFYRLGSSGLVVAVYMSSEPFTRDDI